MVSEFMQARMATPLWSEPEAEADRLGRTRRSQHRGRHTVEVSETEGPVRPSEAGDGVGVASLIGDQGGAPLADARLTLPRPRRACLHPVPPPDERGRFSSAE
jgi:hypothetical protein